MKTPERHRTGTPPSAQNGLRGLYFGVWCYRRATIGASPTTFHTVSEGEFSEVRPHGVLRSFAGLWKDVLFGRRALVLFLLHRVVDRLSHDLAVLDQVGVGPIPYPDVVVLVGPLQECHPSLDRYVGVLEGAMLGQLLTEHVRQLPDPLMPVECAPTLLLAVIHERPRRRILGSLRSRGPNTNGHLSPCLYRKYHIAAP